MKELFRLIDELCRNSRTPLPLCLTLGLDVILVGPGRYLINIEGEHHELPDSTDLLWRRKWRSFLTDHANELQLK